MSSYHLNFCYHIQSSALQVLCRISSICVSVFSQTFCGSFYGKCTCIGYHQTCYATSFRLGRPPMSMRSTSQKCWSSYLRLHTVAGSPNFTSPRVHCCLLRLTLSHLLEYLFPSLDTRCTSRFAFSFFSAASRSVLVCFYCIACRVLLYPAIEVEIPVTS